MLDFGSILEGLIAGISDLIVNQILTLISGLISGLFG